MKIITSANMTDSETIVSSVTITARGRDRDHETSMLHAS